jgi:hypothetical protein
VHSERSQHIPERLEIDTEKDMAGRRVRPDFLYLLQVIPRLHLEDRVDVESMTVERSC